jgi:cytochrome c biogenesis protein
MTAMDRTGKGAVEIEEKPSSFDAFFDSLWNFFSSTKLAIVLILVIAVTSLLGALIVQSPQGLAGDDYSRWLTTIRTKYGFLTDIYSSLGLFTVYSVWWFKALLVALIFNTLICTINRLPTLWSSAFSPRVKVADAMFRNAPIRASIKLKPTGGQRSASQPTNRGAIEGAFSVLADNRYKVFLEEEGSATHFYADKNGVFKLGTILTHVSLILLMIGAVLGTMFGFSNDAFILPEGQTYQVPAETGESFLIRADEFQASFDQSGRPSDYWSDLVIFEGEREVMKQRIRVNEPLEYKGVRFHQSFYGPAPTVEVKDAQGRSIFDGQVVLDQSSGPNAVGFARLPGTGIDLLASFPFNGSPSLPIGVQLYRGQSVVTRDSVRPGETKTVGDYQITYRSHGEFTGLRIVKDPGVPVVWLACTLMVVGICVTLYFPRRRIWGRILGQEMAIAGTADRTVNFRPEFDRLVENIRKA